MATSARSSRASASRSSAVAELCARRGRDAVTAAMDELLAYSERVVRDALSRLPDGRYEGT